MSSGGYSQYPSTSATTGSTAAVLIAFSVGALDGQAATPKGASISSASVFLQSATAANPGIVNSSTQTFAGVKTFNDGFVSASSVSMSAKIISNVADPSGAQDAATKNYVDTQLSAFQPLEAVSLAYTIDYPGLLVANVLTITATGAISIDGSTPSANDRILLKNQSTGAQNGVFVVTTVGSIGVSPVLTRAGDYNTAADANSGASIPVISGTVNKFTIWIQTATIVTINTDSLVFTKYGANPQNLPSAMGVLDGASASATGGTIGSSTLYLQVATSVNPGVVSSGNQTFAGVKTFSVSPLLNSLTASLPLRLDSSKNIITGSVSLTTEVSGILPVANSQRLDQLVGSVSLTTQVSGILPVANSQGLNALAGSVSLTAQVSGILPQGNLTLAPTFTQATLGSVTHTSSAIGAAYTVRWPGTQASGGTFLVNDGKGNLAWQYPFGPVAVKTSNYIIGSSDTVILVGSGTSFVTLPPSENIQGQEFVVKKTFSSLETVVLNTTSSETFDGGLTSFSLDFKNEMIVVQSAGSGSSQSNWLTTGYSSPTFFMTPTVSTSFSINYINCCLYKAATTGGSVSWFGSLTADLNSTAAGTTFNVNVSSGAFTFSGAGSYFQTLNGINLSNNGLVQYCRANGDSIIQTVCTTSPTLTRFGFSGTLKMQKPLTAL